jgi:hypothetical protein
MAPWDMKNVVGKMAEAGTRDDERLPCLRANRRSQTGPNLRRKGRVRSNKPGAPPLGHW